MGKLTALTLTLALIAVPVAAEARCFKFQNDCTETTSTPSRSYIVNTQSVTFMIRATDGAYRFGTACRSATITGRSSAMG